MPESSQYFDMLIKLIDFGRHAAKYLPAAFLTLDFIYYISLLLFNTYLLEYSNY